MKKEKVMEDHTNMCDIANSLKKNGWGVFEMNTTEFIKQKKRVLVLKIFWAQLELGMT